MPTLCSKTMDNFRMNVNDLQSSLHGNPPTAIQFQTACNALLQVQYILQNCISLNGSTACGKALDSLRMNVNDLQSSLHGNPPTAIQFQTACNALLQVQYILQNCISLNGSVACGKALDALRMNVNDLQSSLHGNPPTAIQFQTACNALLQVQYILQNCLVRIATNPTSSSARTSNLSTERTENTGWTPAKKAVVAILSIAVIFGILKFAKAF